MLRGGDRGALSESEWTGRRFLDPAATDSSTLSAVRSFRSFSMLSMFSMFSMAMTVSLQVACNGKTSSPTKPAEAPLASGTSVERFFPLEEGRLYNYETRENGDNGMLVARVHRVDAMHGELHVGGTSKRFVYSREGVAYDGGATILPNTIAEGATWAGEHGGTAKIARVDATVTVPAGTFAGCVETVEEGGRLPGAVYKTTYCPGTGMVLLDVQAPGAEARAALKSYGAPVDVQP